MILKKMLKFIKIILFTSLLLNILGCGLYKPVDARKVSPKASDRAEKNIQEGRGVKLFKSGKKGGVFEFASSNPMWRASIKLLEFTPLSNVDYSGGIIITDWFSDKNKENVYTKITVKFLSNEIRPDGLEVLVYKKNCKSFESCQSNKEDGKINNELKFAILKKAAQIEKTDLVKKNN